MDSRDLVSMFKINHSALHANIDDVSVAESLIRPDKGCNSLNWVLGHIMLSRDVILEALGLKKILTQAESYPYRRGSDPNETPPATSFNRLVEAFDESQRQLIARLWQLSPDELQATEPSIEGGEAQPALGDYLRFLNFHETYHVGQTGVLRRMIGKAGAIA